MKSRGGNARSGDVIPYVFCLCEGEESAKSAQADRARHPDEFRKATDLTIGERTLKSVWITLNTPHADYEYYISQQVLPPIERLCEPIEGTDRSRLAECLGRYCFFLQSFFCLILVNCQDWIPGGTAARQRQGVKSGLFYHSNHNCRTRSDSKMQIHLLFAVVIVTFRNPSSPSAIERQVFTDLATLLLLNQVFHSHRSCWLLASRALHVRSESTRKVFKRS